MGVSITAYSRMEVTEPHPLTDDCYDADHVNVFADPSHAASYEGLADADKTTTTDRGWTFIGGRCYQPTQQTKTLDVADMSHGGYSRWRAIVARAAYGVSPEDVWANLDRFTGAPFIELVHFADNEGSIGPVAAARLAAAFSDPARRTHYLETLLWQGFEPRIVDYYAGWWDAFAAGFTLAADGGLVRYS